jgi:nitrile hydratase accessory protein
MRDAALRNLPGIPMDADSPVFNEPWEARAFAMTLALYERGVFTWPQWAEVLSRQIELARAAGDEDLGDTYYQHWLRALESLVSDLRV